MFPILIVDDSREDRDLAEHVIREAKILNPVWRFPSGETCLNFLTGLYSGAQGFQEPCLIFVDLAMPVMSGPQTIAAINDKLNIPRQFIVMLSGLTDTKLIREGYQLGARTFLSKPLTVVDLNRFFETNEATFLKQLTAPGYVLRWL